MKNIYYLPLILLATASLPVFSKTLTPDEALRRIENSKFKSMRMPSRQSMQLKYTLKDKKNEAALYVFDKNSESGYMIVSADDSTLPVLGYSDNGKFDPNNIPPELGYWLDEYARQIEYMRDMGYPALNTESESSLPALAAIEPLVKTKWNQGAPYNKYCYTIAADGTETKSVTGCVATAMAQVMYYFQYPTVGKGEISYKHGDSGTYSMNFATQPFDWSEMLTTYYPDSYTAEEEDAVSYLMKACGYSVKMDYGKGESGASGANIPGALIDYFGYNDGIQLVTRDFYTYSDWMQMIYENLAQTGPVVYDGSALDGGHSFVCDGYDGNGYFHINWGWGGMSDGYYLLDALNPDEFGIGGAAGGYNLGQQVILGITPKQSDTFNSSIMQFGSVTGEINDNKLSLDIARDGDDFQYIDARPITVTFGVMVENATDESQTVQYFESNKKDLEGKQGTSYNWKEVGTTVDLDKVDMTIGDEYKFVIGAYITSGGSSEWTAVVPVPGKYNYVSVVKTESGYELKNNSVGNISVSDFRILSATVYQNMPVKFSATFTNETDIPLTRNYSAVFFDSAGKECFKMENYSINVDGDSSVTDTWSSVDWYKENDATDVTTATEYTMKLYDNWEGSYVDGIEQTVTIEPELKETVKVESELTIEGATKDGDVYVVSGNQIDVSLKVKVLEGFFNKTIMFAIQMPLSDGDYYTVMHKHFDAIPELSAGEEQTMSMIVDFSDAEPDKVYRIEVWGPDNGFNEKVLVKFDLTNSGIQSISPDQEGLYRVYSIDGRHIMVDSEKPDIHNLPKGIYIVNGKKIIN